MQGVMQEDEIGRHQAQAEKLFIYIAVKIPQIDALAGVIRNPRTRNASLLRNLRKLQEFHHNIPRPAHGDSVTVWRSNTQDP
jgi:hypothetical protein